MRDFSSTTGREIPFLNSLPKELIPNPPIQYLAPFNVDGVCKAYRMGRDEIMAPGRGRLASEARSAIGLIVQEQPEITIAEAAEAFRRDSSTLSAGAARLRSRMNRDGALRDRIENMIKRPQITVSNA